MAKVERETCLTVCEVDVDYVGEHRRGSAGDSVRDAYLLVGFGIYAQMGKLPVYFLRVKERDHVVPVGKANGGTLVEGRSRFDCRLGSAGVYVVVDVGDDDLVVGLLLKSPYEHLRFNVAVAEDLVVEKTCEKEVGRTIVLSLLSPVFLA